MQFQGSDSSLFKFDFFSSDVENHLLGVIIAAVLGLLIGLEREYSHRSSEEENQRELFAGIRTFPIISVLGYLTYYLGEASSYWVFVIALAGVFFLAAISYWNASQRFVTGATSQFTIIIAFLIGGIVFTGALQLAVLITVLVTALLALKLKLHSVITHLKRTDILAMVQFMILVVLVYPLLPDQFYGPYEVLNPREIWLIIILLVGVNFAGYLIAKFFGEGKGVIVTGVLGGFSSSTAITWLLARRSKEHAGREPEEAAAILLASAIMFPRVLVWLYILNQTLFRQLLVPILVIGLIGAGVGVFLIKTYYQGKMKGEESVIKNPLNLIDALKFGLIFSAILVLVAFARDNFGQEGVLIASGISGLTDVDAITISIAKLEGGKVAVDIARNAVVIGAMANTFLKYILCLVVGGNKLKKFTSYGFLSMLVVGILYLIFF